jgi:hypothetical protein
VLGSALLPLCYRPATWPATTCNHLQPPATRPGARHPRTYRVCSATPRLRTSLSCPECCHDTTADTARRGDEPQCIQHPSTRATKLCSALFSFRPVHTHPAHTTAISCLVPPYPACLPACPTPRRVRRQRGMAVGHRPVRLLLGTLSSRKFAQTFPSPIQTLALGIVTTLVPSPFFPLPLQPHASCRACLCDTARMPNAPNAPNAYPGLGPLASVACCFVAAHRIVP